MNSLLITLAISLFCFCGILLGAFIRKRLPEHHLSSDSKDIVKLGTGLVASLTALILGLLVASANTSYRSFNDGMNKVGADVLTMDRAMAYYGPETQEARASLRRLIISVVLTNWPEDTGKLAVHLEPSEVVGIQLQARMPARTDAAPYLESTWKVLSNADALSDIQNMLFKLSPRDDMQRWRKSRALDMSGRLAEDRMLMIEQTQSTLPTPFLVVLVIWLVILFASFSLFAPGNKTVSTILFLCALSVSGSIFLILEFNSPTNGLLKAPSSPFIRVIDLIGK